MSKPATVPTWATSATYSGGPLPGTPTKVAPLAGQISDGFEPDEKPSAQVVNHRLGLLGDWTTWLDGLFDGADKLTIPDLEVTDDATIGGDLAVTDDATIGGDLTVTGAIKRGDRTIHLPAAAFVADSARGSLTQSGYLVTTAVSIAYARIPVEVGQTIKSVTVYYDRNGAGAMQPAVRRIDPASGTITAVWVGTDDNTGSGIESQSNAPNHVALDQAYWVECSFTAVQNRLYGAKIVYGE